MLTEPGAALSRGQYFWVQLALLGAGIAGLGGAHEVASWEETASTSSATLRAGVLVGVSLGAVARAAYVIVAAALSDAYRVFHARHLLACAALLAAAGLLVGASIVGGPFDRVLAHGHITGADLADLGSVLAALVCAIGVVVASMGAWDAFRDERTWYRTLRRGHRAR